jgi:hypothetical protein
MSEMNERRKTNDFGRIKMSNSDPDVSRFSHSPREEVFERLNNAMTDLAHYIPSARQNPYWKARIVNAFSRKWEEWSFMNGWTDDYDFPRIEECFKSMVEELGILAQVILLDPRLQIEVVDVDAGDSPTWACQVQRYEWIKRFVEVRPATRILLTLSQPSIERLPQEEVMADLRHELGHVFLYLRDSEAKDDCCAADEEWERARRMEDFIG